MNLLVLSDIHANVSALTAVLNDAKQYAVDALILLGDHIDYGMRPNETIEILKVLPFPVDANIWGNHEKAVIDGELDRFSGERGRDFSRYTARILNAQSRDYIINEMCIQGFTGKTYNEKQYLMIHGSLDDTFWKSISPDNTGDVYAPYDFVLSGHSHLPFYFERYYTADSVDTRGKKRTVFINPGSVGQPRNHNPRACYALIHTESGTVHLNTAEYDIRAEQALYGNDVDAFYKFRLEKGI